MKIADTPAELRKYIFIEGQEIVKQYIDAATGRAELPSHNADCRKKIFDIVKAMALENTTDLYVGDDGGSPAAIIRAVEKGKCTPEEGAKLMELYAKAAEIEQQGKPIVSF